MIKKVSVALTIIVILLGMTACGGNAGQYTTDGAVDAQVGDRQGGHDETLELEDRSEVEKGRAEDEDRTDVENEASDLKGESEDKEAAGPENEFVDEKTGGQTEMKMNVQIGDYNFTATLESNAAVDELADMMKEGPVTIDMDDYSGFEKVGSLGRSLTTSNSQTTTAAGDIVLYNGSNIVMFYGSNSWSYTRIGKIDDLTDWEKALGKGSITAIFTVAE